MHVDTTPLTTLLLLYAGIMLSLLVIGIVILCRNLVAVRGNQIVTMRTSQKKNSLLLTYPELFTLLDVTIVTEVTNFININNLTQKTGDSISAELEEDIIDLSTKIYTNCISPLVIENFKIYVTEDFIIEYISRSVRNNIIKNSYKG